MREMCLDNEGWSVAGGSPQTCTSHFSGITLSRETGNFRGIGSGLRLLSPSPNMYLIISPPTHSVTLPKAIAHIATNFTGTCRVTQGCFFACMILTIYSSSPQWMKSCPAFTLPFAARMQVLTVQRPKSIKAYMGPFCSVLLTLPMAFLSFRQNTLPNLFGEAEV